MSKLDAKTLNTAQTLMDKHDKDEIYVKISNGQMYFNKTSAQYGLYKKEFEASFEVVKREVKKEAKKEAPITNGGGSGSGNEGASNGEEDKLIQRRAEYEKLAEKKVFNGWDVQTLEAKIKELKESQSNPE